jgi:virginiamycin B lyase
VGLASALCVASAAAASFTEYQIPTAGSFPGGIAAGPDGALWFTEQYANQIGRLTTNGSFTEFGGLSAPRPGYPGPSSITAGSDGRLWFTEPDVNKIGAITTAGVVNEYSSGLTPGAGLGQIIAGPDGRLWFTEHRAGKIGAITMAGTITEYPLPTSDAGPSGLTVGSDGAIWILENQVNAVVRMWTDGTVLFERPLSDSAVLDKIVFADGALWLPDFYTNKIGKYSISEASLQLFGPALDSYGLAGITLGPDDALWFTDGASDMVGRITTAGLITNEIPLTQSSTEARRSPGEITSGPDGALWFTETGVDKIGRITTDVPPPPTVELRVSVSPPSDPGRFDLSIDDELKKAAAGNGDTTGKLDVSVMNHWVLMSGAQTSTEAYRSAISCRDQGGSGATIPTSFTDLFSTFYLYAPLRVPSGSDIVCEILNRRRRPPTDLNVTQTSGIVKASWILSSVPPEPLTGFLEFSKTPDTDSDGFFTDPATVAYLFDNTDTTFDSTPETFPPGTYYVHVSAFDPDTCDDTGSCDDDFSSPPVKLVVPSPGPPPRPPPTSSAPIQHGSIDKATAFASLRVPLRQKLGKLYVQAAMGEPGTITVRGRLRIAGRSRSYGFATVSAPAVPGTTVRLRLKLSKKAFTAVRRALKRHKKVTAKITITATDLAGNAKRERRLVGLRP